MVRSSLFKELLEVVCGWPRLTLAATRDCHGVLHVGAAYLHVEVIIIVGCGLLLVLLMPFLVALGALLGVLDGNIGRCSPDAAQGQVRLGHLVVDSMLGGNAASLLGGVLEDVS
jgi:hypothetical protein